MKKQTLTIYLLVILALFVVPACSVATTASQRMLGSAQQAQKKLSQAAGTIAETSNNPAKNQSSVVAQATVAAPSAAPVQPGILSAYETTLENIYTQVSPSVVNIRVVQNGNSSNQNPQQGLPFGLPGQQQGPQFSQGLGSGFVWDKDGHIVTNNHVIDGADKIEVTFSDGTIVPATLVGKDVNSDLGVVKVDIAADRLQPIQLADSTQVKVGQLAIAIGNPYGLQGTMTVGIVSALGRTLPVGEGNFQGPTYSIPDIIQTDAPINPGNSGGVLVDDKGQVIGVTAAIESASGANAGIGFVIPSAIVQKVVPSLIQNGKYEFSWLGIQGTSLTPDLAKAMSLKSEQRGALVESTTEGGPAAKAGLQGSEQQTTVDGQSVNVGGDVIVAIDGQPVEAMDDLIAYLASSTSVGQKVTLTILRNGSEKNIDVTLQSRPAQQPLTADQQAPSNSSPQNPGQGNQNQGNPAGSVYLGIAGIGVNADIAQAMNLPADQAGVLIEQVQAGSPAEKAGLQASDKPVTINGQSVLVGGDIITAVNGQAISSVEELRAILQQAKVGEQVELTVLRNGQQTTVQATLAERPN